MAVKLKMSEQDLKNELAELRRENDELRRDLENASSLVKPDEYLLLLDNIDTHVFYLLDPATYGIVNRAHADFFGVAKSDLEQKNLYDVLSKDEADVCIAGNQQIFADKKQVVTEEVMKRADGQERLFSFTKTPKLGDDGKTLYVVCTGEDITEKKNAERLLSFTQFTIDQAKIAIFWCHSDGRFFYVNKTACDWLQYSFDELKQMHAADINPEFPQENWEEHWLDIKKRGLVHMESVHRRKNGEDYPVELYSNYVEFEGEEYKLSFVNDISPRVQAREALAATEAFLQNVIESIQDGVCVLDTDLNIVHTNKVMCSWYQGDQELLGKKCFKAFHDADISCKKCPTKRALASGSSESEIVPGRPGTSPEWLEVFSYPIKEPGTDEITGVVEFVRDISEKIRLQRQLSQAQKMEAIGTLSGGIAHDFNNILQAMLGSIQLLLSQKGVEHPDRRYLTVLEKSVDRAQQLTSRLLYVGRNIESDLRPVNLNEEMKDQVKLLERSLPKMVFIDQVYGDQLQLIKADITQIQQVVLNLAINASQAMPDGGKLLLQTGNTYIDEAYVNSNQGFDVGDYVVLVISDTGCGMDDETLNNIYDPFFTTKSIGEGTGLGLSMAYGIVKNHGGVMTCYSEVGVGTTFKIYFPAILHERRQLSREIVEDPLTGGTETILIVDDEQILLELGCDILAGFGYTVLKADSGETALDLLHLQKEHIDLVVLDLNMPGMGGHKCLEEIQKLTFSPKVIIASGYSMNGNAQVMLDSGAQGFLAKPFQVRKFITTVRQVLDEKY